METNAKQCVTRWLVIHMGKTHGIGSVFNGYLVGRTDHLHSSGVVTAGTDQLVDRPIVQTRRGHARCCTHRADPQAALQRIESVRF